jgi:hypothetical protein
MNRTKNISRVKLLIAFDEDDPVGMDHFTNTIQDELDRRNVNWEALVFEPMGYIRLNEYVNELARKCDAKWFMFWNDDAMMETTNWDEEILKYNDQFKILAVHTHKEHPYSIFPIVPRGWLDLFDYLSPHQMSDAWISQVAYMLDILERIPVWVTHDRFDLTGNNHDETYKNRPQLEGNPNNPNDFHSTHWHTRRVADTEKIANHLKDLGVDTSWWENIKANKQNPWEKLEANDINRQMSSTRSNNGISSGVVNVPTT